MVRTGVERQLGVHARLPQRAMQPFALRARDEPVGRAVQQQERRSSSGDVGDGAGLSGGIGDRGRRCAQQPGLAGIRVHRIGAGIGRHGRQIARRVPGDDGADPARRPGHSDAALERGVVHGQAEQFGQVTAGRLAPGRDPLAVDAEFAGAGAQPADGRLDVMELRRPLRLTGQPVVGAGHGDARARQLLERRGLRTAERGARQVAAARPPAAAVQEQHGRRRSAGSGGSHTSSSSGRIPGRAA